MKNSEPENSVENPKSVTKPGKLPPKSKKLIGPAELVKHWHKTPDTNEKPNAATAASYGAAETTFLLLCVAIPAALIPISGTWGKTPV